MIQLQQVIGEGSYGVVYKGYIKAAQNVLKGPFAFKVKKEVGEVEGKDQINGTIFKRFWREAAYLKQCSHPNIIELIKIVKLADQRECLILQLLECKLIDYCRKKSLAADSMLIKSLLQQILEAINFIHQKGYAHRDVKPQNLMVKNGHAKIIDFGFVRNLHSVEQITKQVVNYQYRAPEIILGTKYSEKIDIWSLGCVFYLLSEGRFPFEGSCDLQCLMSIGTKASSIPFRFANLAYNKFKLKLNNMKKQKLQFKEATPYLLQQLIEQMLEFNPDQRISAKAALAHPFFFKMPKVSFRTRLTSPVIAPRRQPTMAEQQLKTLKQIKLPTNRKKKLKLLKFQKRTERPNKIE